MIKPDEIELCTELTYMMLLTTITPAINGPRRTPEFKKGARFEHFFMSAFEDVCAVTSEFGLIRGVDKQGRLQDEKGFKHVNELVVDPHLFRECLIASVDDADISISEVVDAFIAMNISHQGELSVTREEFTPPEEFIALLTQMSLHGYLTQHEEAFKWTEKIAPHMIEHYLWNEDRMI